MNKEKLYTNKEDGHYAYVLKKGGYINYILVETNNKELKDMERIMKEEKFFVLYEKANEQIAKEVLDYFEQVEEILKLEKEIKNKKKKLEKEIKEKRKTLIQVEKKETDELRERMYEYDGFVMNKKVDLARMLGMNTATLDVYIKELGLSNYYMTEEDVESIVRLKAQKMGKQNVYKYGKIETNDVRRFLFRMGIPYSIFSKWKKEEGKTLEDLTTKEGVESLVAYHASKKKTKKMV